VAEISGRFSWRVVRVVERKGIGEVYGDFKVAGAEVAASFVLVVVYHKVSPGEYLDYISVVVCIGSEERTRAVSMRWSLAPTDPIRKYRQ
jgi:hypothetical protein